MKYECGTEVMLYDVITVGYGPDQESMARVVAIGADLAIDEIDQAFYSWAKREGIINEETVVIEWLGVNPLGHDDPNYAPVGNYMTLQCLCLERFVRRGTTE